MKRSARPGNQADNQLSPAAVTGRDGKTQANRKAAAAKHRLNSAPKEMALPACGTIGCCYGTTKRFSFLFLA
jgi:hypothetical protein